MEVLLSAAAICFGGYLIGAAVANIRNKKQTMSQPQRHCGICNYCYPISAATKSLMPKPYSNKSVCLMCRGSTVPVGYNGCTISVVNEDSFCDQWKERIPDG